jgi:hypothetical protein
MIHKIDAKEPTGLDTLAAGAIMASRSMNKGGEAQDRAPR